MIIIILRDVKVVTCMIPVVQKRFGVYGVKRHFQQYFSYIVAISFISGGNRSTRRKPPT